MNKQKGAGLIGTLLIIFALVAVVVIGMRAVPVYFQYYTLVESVKSLNSMPASAFSGDPVSDMDVLRSSISKRLDINQVQDLKKDQLIITPQGENQYVVTIKYQDIRPLVYNVSLLFDFNKKIEVKIGSEH